MNEEEKAENDADLNNNSSNNRVDVTLFVPMLKNAGSLL